MSTPEMPANQAAEELPKLSAADFRTYNALAEKMNYFHEHFRQDWNTMYHAASTNKRPAGMSIRQFLAMGLQFCRSLEVHHGIEEQHIFPVLAKRMPAFRKELELLTQHKQIHKGLDRMQEYLDACRNGDKDFRFEELREIMNSYGSVLWAHLEDEVKQLGAENMRKYWTKDEIRMIPF